MSSAAHRSLRLAALGPNSAPDPGRVPKLDRQQTEVLASLFDEAIACDGHLARSWERIYTICGLTRVPRYATVTLDRAALKDLDERLFSLRMQIAQLCAALAPAAIRALSAPGFDAGSLRIRYGDLRDKSAKTLLRRIFEEAGVFYRLA